MLDGGLAFRTSNPDKITDIKFTEFMKDEDRVIDEIMSRMLNGERKTIKMEGNNKSYVSHHRYQLADWDIESVELNGMFQRYNDLLERLNK